MFSRLLDAEQITKQLLLERVYALKEFPVSFGGLEYKIID